MHNPGPPHKMTTATDTTTAAPTPTFSTVIDDHGNRTFFPDGEVPPEVHGAPIDIIDSGLTWTEAHDWVNA